MSERVNELRGNHQENIREDNRNHDLIDVPCTFSTSKEGQTLVCRFKVIQRTKTEAWKEVRKHFSEKHYGIMMVLTRDRCFNPSSVRNKFPYCSDPGCDLDKSKINLYPSLWLRENHVRKYHEDLINMTVQKLTDLALTRAAKLLARRSLNIALERTAVVRSLTNTGMISVTPQENIGAQSERGDLEHWMLEHGTHLWDTNVEPKAQTIGLDHEAFANELSESGGSSDLSTGEEAKFEEDAIATR